jgi:hypothetical protein
LAALIAYAASRDDRRCERTGVIERDVGRWLIALVVAIRRPALDLGLIPESASSRSEMERC